MERGRVRAIVPSGCGLTSSQLLGLAMGGVLAAEGDVVRAAAAAGGLGRWQVARLGRLRHPLGASKGFVGEQLGWVCIAFVRPTGKSCSNLCQRVGPALDLWVRRCHRASVAKPTFV